MPDLNRVESVLTQVEDWGIALRDARRPCEHQANMVESHSVGESLIAHVRSIRVALAEPPEDFNPDWELPTPLTESSDHA